MAHRQNCRLELLLNELGKPMMGREMCEIRRRFGCTQNHLAMLIGRVNSTLSQYECGVRPIPQDIAILMRLIDHVLSTETSPGKSQ